jgi:hypothetical protein
VVRCRKNRRTRRSTADVVEAETNAVAGVQRPYWMEAAAASVDALVRVLAHYSLPTCTTGAQFDGDQFTKPQVKQLHRFGLVRSRQLPLPVRAAATRAAVMSAAAVHMVVLWMDNYYRMKYGVNPQKFCSSLNGTAVTALHTSGTVHFDGHPSLLQLYQRVEEMSVLLRTSADTLLACANRWRDALHDDVRVPMDIRRRDVRSLQWRPLALLGVNCSATEALPVLIRTAVDMHAVTRKPVPVLLDINLHYRLCKCLYAVSHAPFAFSRAMQSMPLLFGVWHPYKYVCMQVYATFFSVLAPVIATLTGTTDQVSNRPKLMYKERLFAGLLLCTPAVRELILATLGALQQQSAAHPAVGKLAVGFQQMQGLWWLLSQWIPVCFHIGFLVRDCTWAGRTAGSGPRATVILRLCFCLLRLCKQHRGVTQYLNGIVVALLTWTECHGGIPACCHVEEACEAMLGRFSQRAKQDPTAEDLIEMCNLFVTLPPVSTSLHSCHRAVGPAFVKACEGAVRKYVQDVADCSLPYYPLAPGNLSGPLPHWPPLAVWQTTGAFVVAPLADVRLLVRRALVTLTAPSKLTVDQMVMFRELAGWVSRATYEHRLTVYSLMRGKPYALDAATVWPPSLLIGPSATAADMAILRPVLTIDSDDEDVITVHSDDAVVMMDEEELLEDYASSHGSGSANPSEIDVVDE